VKKKRLAPYLLLSIFAHMGLLLGIDALSGSPSKVIPIELLPIETVILKKEAVVSQPQTFLSEQTSTREALETKSQASTRSTANLKAEEMVLPVPKEVSFKPRLIIDQARLLDFPAVDQARERKVVETKNPLSIGTETSVKIRDLAGPIPKQGDFEPSLKVDSVPTLGVLPSSREGKQVLSKPIVSTFQMPPLRLSPVQSSRSDEPRPREIEMPKALAKAETGGVQRYSQTQKKIEAPIGRSRASADFVSELPPIPTIEFPSMPEQREMFLAVSDNLPTVRLARSETKRGPQPITEPDLRLAHKKELVVAPTPMVPKDKPTIPDLKSDASLPVPGSEKGAAFLFVLDTSGSVKGVPLEGIKRSAWEFVGLMGGNDRAGIMTFNDKAELVRPFTSEKRVLRREINKVRTRGRKTILFDALILAISLIQKEDRESKFLILFSDGKDEGSRSTPQEVIRNIRLTGVSILCVGYSRVERKYLDTLKTIAAETGGISTDTPQFQDVVMLYKTARDISSQTAKSDSSHR